MVTYSASETEKYAKRGATPGAEKVLKALGKHTVEKGKIRKKTKAELAAEKKAKKYGAKASASTAEIVERETGERTEDIGQPTKIKQTVRERTNRAKEMRQAVAEKEKYNLYRSSYTAQAQQQSPNIPKGASTDLSSLPAAQEVRRGDVSVIYDNIPFRGVTRPAYIQEVNQPQTYTLSFGEGTRPTEDEGFILDEYLKGSVKPSLPSTRTQRFKSRVKSALADFVTKGETRNPEEAGARYLSGQKDLFSSVKLKEKTVSQRLEQNLNALTKDTATQTGVLFVASRVISGPLKFSKRFIEQPITSTAELYGASKLFKLIGKVPVVGKFLPGTTIAGGIAVHAGSVAIKQGALAGAGAAIEDVSTVAALYGGYKVVRRGKIKADVKAGSTYTNKRAVNALVKRLDALESLKSKGVSVRYLVKDVEGINVIGRVKGPLINSRIVAQYGPLREIGNLPGFDYYSVRGTVSSLVTPPAAKPGITARTAIGVIKPVSIDIAPKTWAQLLAKQFPQAKPQGLLEGQTFAQRTNNFFRRAKAQAGELLSFSKITPGRGNTLFEEAGVRTDATAGDIYTIGRFKVRGVRQSPAQPRTKGTPAKNTPSGIKGTAGQVSGSSRPELPRTFIEKFKFNLGKAIRLVEYKATGGKKVLQEIVAYGRPARPSGYNLPPGIKITPKKIKPSRNAPKSQLSPGSAAAGGAGPQTTVLIQKPVVVQAIKVKPETKQGVKATVKTLDKILGDAGQKVPGKQFQDSKQEGFYQQGTKQQIKLRQINAAKQRQRQIVNRRQAFANLFTLVPRSSSVTKSKSILSQLTAQSSQLSSRAAARSKVAQRTAQAQAVQGAQLSTQRPALSVSASLRAAQISKLRSRKVSPPSETPPGFFQRPQFLTPESSQRQAGFNVLIRRRGVFRLANPQPLTRIQAEQFGAFKVGTTAAASFKLQTAGAPAVKSAGFGRLGNLRDFVKRAGVYTEKRGRRIKSRGELQEITFKGLAVQRSKLFRGVI